MKRKALEKLESIAKKTKPKTIRDMPDEILQMIADQASTPYNGPGYISGLKSKRAANRLLQAKKNSTEPWILNDPVYEPFIKQALFQAVFPGRFNLYKEYFTAGHENDPDYNYKNYKPSQLPATFEHINFAFNLPWPEGGYGLDRTWTNEDILATVDEMSKEAYINEMKKREKETLLAQQAASLKKDAVYTK
jgi:hypothetical protein